MGEAGGRDTWLAWNSGESRKWPGRTVPTSPRVGEITVHLGEGEEEEEVGEEEEEGDERR